MSEVIFFSLMVTWKLNMAHVYISDIEGGFVKKSSSIIFPMNMISVMFVSPIMQLLSNLQDIPTILSD